MVADLDNCSRFTQFMRLVEILTSHPQYIEPFLVLLRTEASPQDYPHRQKFSDEQFSFSVISFAKIYTSLGLSPRKHDKSGLENIKPCWALPNLYQLLVANPTKGTLRLSRSPYLKVPSPIYYLAILTSMTSFLPTQPLIYHYVQLTDGFEPLFSSGYPIFSWGFQNYYFLI